jgi:hypothetical protein
MSPHLPPDLFTLGFLTCLGTVFPLAVAGLVVLAVVRCAF